MVNSIKKVPVPWEHASSEAVATWTWNTPHFTATIFAEGLAARKIFNWKIVDKSTGLPRPFDSGAAMSFIESSDSILETIAKSYSRELGYQKYAGELATTFQISGGEKYDFISCLGQKVVMQAYDDNGNEVTLRGLFDIHNYDFALTTGTRTILVPPIKVKDVLREYGLTSLIKTQRSVKRNSTSRTVNEEWVKGCTGKPGYRPGTAQHGPNDPYCSIHNI